MRNDRQRLCDALEAIGCPHQVWQDGMKPYAGPLAGKVGVSVGIGRGLLWFSPDGEFLGCDSGDPHVPVLRQPGAHDYLTAEQKRKLRDRAGLSIEADLSGDDSSRQVWRDWILDDLGPGFWIDVLDTPNRPDGDEVIADLGFDPATGEETERS